MFLLRAYKRLWCLPITPPLPPEKKKKKCIGGMKFIFYSISNCAITRKIHKKSKTSRMIKDVMFPVGLVNLVLKTQINY